MIKDSSDIKKMKADRSAITRDLNDFDKETGNIYESVAIISKRADQIAADLKEEITTRLSDYATSNTESGDEISENTEQIEIAKLYEQVPKPVLLAIQEFKEDKIYYRLNKPDQE